MLNMYIKKHSNERNAYKTFKFLVLEVPYLVIDLPSMKVDDLEATVFDRCAEGMASIGRDTCPGVQ